VPDAVNGDRKVSLDHQFITGNGRATRHFSSEAAPKTPRDAHQAIPAIG
jgi:hypothetical protein